MSERAKGKTEDRASAKASILELLASLEDSFQSNDDVRSTEAVLYAIASNVVVLVLSGKAKAPEPLGEVLRRAAEKITGRKEKRRLAKLGKMSDELEEYADKSRYDGLSDSQIEEANALRQELYEGLSGWIESLPG